MEHEYLSVREFAARAGVSVQAIYKRLSNENDELNNWFNESDGKKTISAEALNLFQAEKAESKSEGNSTSCQSVDNQLTTKIIDMLQAELEAKNRQIDQLQQLLSQEQQLHAIAEQRILMLESGKTEEPEDQPDPAAEPVAEADPQPTKKWWQFWK